VREGDNVRKDQPVVNLNKEVLQLQLKQAYSAYKAAEAQYKKALRGVRKEELENAQALVEQAEKELATARTNLGRTRELYKAGAVPQARLEDAENRLSAGETQLDNAKRSLRMMTQGASEEELEMAQSNMEAAEAQYELAQLNYNNAEIKAPVDGLVARVMVDEGNMAGPNTPLMALVQHDRIVAKVQLPEKYFGRITNRGVGIEARVYPIAYPDNKAFPGTVTAVSPIIDATSRTFTLDIFVDNRERRLTPGMYVNVELVLGQVENALLIPESSLVYREEKQVVFVTEGEDQVVAHMKPVSVGLRKNGTAEIQEGLNIKDRIIIRGNAFLEDGQKVYVVDG
jgi:RND family efflux transporter MFP subunit